MHVTCQWRGAPKPRSCWPAYHNPSYKLLLLLQTLTWCCSTSLMVGRTITQASGSHHCAGFQCQWWWWWWWQHSALSSTVEPSWASCT